MKHRVTRALLLATIVFFGRDGHAEDLACQTLQNDLKSYLLEGNFEAYKSLDMPFEPPCEGSSLVDAILARLYPSGLLQCEIRMQNQGVNLPDTSLQRLVFEQVRWELVEFGQAVNVIGQVSLRAPDVQWPIRWIQWGGIGLFALLSFIFIWKHHDSHRIIVARNPSTQAWFPEVEELRVRLKKAKTANQLKLALFDLKYNEFNERLLQAKGEEWLLKPRRDRELIFMLLNQWSNEEICTRLSVSETHLYRLRSKLRCDLGLASDDLLIPALLAWSS